MRRWIVRLVLLLVLALGAMTVNYNTAHSGEHHREWAQARGYPEPSPWIYNAGMALMVVGGVSLGFSLGRGKGD